MVPPLTTSTPRFRSLSLRSWLSRLDHSAFGNQPLKIGNGSAQPFSQRDDGAPAKHPFRLADVGPSFLWIIWWEAAMDDFGARASQLKNQFGELANGEFGLVAQIDGASHLGTSFHHGYHAGDQIIDIAKRPCLFTFAKDGDVLIA